MLCQTAGQRVQQPALRQRGCVHLWWFGDSDWQGGALTCLVQNRWSAGRVARVGGCQPAFSKI